MHSNVASRRPPPVRADCDKLHRFAVLLLLFVATSATADTLTGRVVAVADGDTITVLDASHVQHKIRLAGIDSPEKAQPFGQRSKQNLSALVYRKDVTVEWSKRDRYGRIVGKSVNWTASMRA